MKVACAAWGFREMKLDEYFEAVRALGIPFVEVNCTQSVPKHLSPKATPEEAKQISELAQSLGVKVVALAASNDFTTENEASWRNHVEAVKYVVDLAEAAGAEVVRIFAGWTQKVDNAAFERAARGIREVGEYAEAKGIAIAVENHGGITATGEQCAKLLGLVGELPNVGLNYDPANFAYYGEDPLHALKAIGKRVAYCHLKDVRRTPDGKPEYCAVGDGEINWAPIFEELRSFYVGYLAVEYERSEDVVDGTKRSLETIRTFLGV